MTIKALAVIALLAVSPALIPRAANAQGPGTAAAAYSKDELAGLGVEPLAWLPGR